MNQNIQRQIDECMEEFEQLTSDQQKKFVRDMIELTISGFQHGKPYHMQEHMALEALSCIGGALLLAQIEEV